MRLSIMCLSLSFLATEVLASVSAGPFESVFFYYAYRIDCMTLPGANFIGSGCPGSGPGGVCKFDEFVKWIQDDGHPWTGHTSIGDNLDPDVWEASNELRASGCQNKYDAHKLFPALYPPGSVPSYEALMEEMVHSFQSDRRLWTDAAKLRSQLKNIRKAFGLVYEARTGAMADKLVQAVDKLLKHRKIGMKCRTHEVELAHGYKVTLVDTLETIKAHPGMGEEFQNTIASMVNSWHDKNNKSRSHFRILATLQALQERLVSSPC